MSALKKWRLFWSPEGKPLAVVEALDAKKAIRKAPLPYRKYLGEIYAEEVNPERCAACRHTLKDHEDLGWSCDCAICPWKKVKP